MRQYPLWMYGHAGRIAWRSGKGRDEHHIADKKLRLLWQAGWDAAVREDAISTGSAAKVGDRNPYTDPELAACWTRGWKATHGFAVIGGKKNPDSRDQDANPGIVKP